jgi:PAS domain-containing protein
MNSKLFYAKSALVGLVFAAIFWCAEALIHVYVFEHGSDSFLADFIPVDPSELWMRSFSSFLFFLLIIVYAVMGRERNTVTQRMKLAYQALTVMREGCLVTDSKNRIIYVNPRYEEITGYKFSEVVGNNPSVSSSGKQRDAFYQEMWAAIDKCGF